MNQMLQKLTKADWVRWQDALEPIELRAGEVVFEVGDPIGFVYFPVTSILSISCILIEGASIEVAMIGSEGMAGMPGLMGNGVATNRGVVVLSGKAYRLRGSWVIEEYKKSPHLMRMMLQFTQAFMTQLTQVGACNCHHPLEQRLSRWLLLFADRAMTEQIMCTQEQIANTIGVRRERLTKAARELQQMGLIRYARGKIVLLSREALKAHTCECYSIIKSAYEPLGSLIEHRQ